MAAEIIALWAPMGHGKTTAAEQLVRAHGFTRRGFADPLKRLCGDVFDLPDAALYGPSAARNASIAAVDTAAYWDGTIDRALHAWPRLRDLFRDAPTPVGAVPIMRRLWDVMLELRAYGAALTPRQILQQMGTDWGRALWPDVWVHAAVRAARETPGPVVFDDCRFANEAQAIHAAGGRVWWIDATPRLTADPGAFAHASEATYEQARAHVDGIVRNHLDRDHLAAQVDLALLVWRDERKVA